MDEEIGVQRDWVFGKGIVNKLQNWIWGQSFLFLELEFETFKGVFCYRFFLKIFFKAFVVFYFYQVNYDKDVLKGIECTSDKWVIRL